MLTSVIFEIGCLVFIILLIISYNTKKFNVRLSNKAYKFLIYDQIVMLLFEILTAVIFENTSSKFVINLTNRLTWTTGIVYFYMFYIYSFVHLKKLNYKSIKDMLKDNTEPRLFTYITIFATVLFLALPFKELTMENYNYIPGAAAIEVVVYSCLACILVSKLLIYMKTLTRREKWSIWSTLILVIFIVPLQIIFPKILFIGMGTSFQLFILYFLIENPDLRLIEEIDSLKYTIDRSSKAKSDFLSNMSHEIRSPMNAIIGFSETIINDKEFDREKVLNDIGHIKSSSKNLLDIINNILDISKIETGNDTLEEKEYSLASHIIDWSGIVETRLESKNIKFILDVDRTIPSKLYGDATKVFQVVLNVLTNAVKYTEVGRIRMVIAKEDINSKTIKLKFKVSDTGFGIKKEDYDKVFQKFSRLDSATTNEIEGTGLGLVLTKKYAKLMGGDIWFESEYGAGSTFYFEIPQVVVDSTPMGDITQKIEDETNKVLINCNGLKALIVDDDELNLKVTKRLLEAYNFNIEVSSNPEECINKFKLGEHYDIVFLDHIMPKIDGVELMKVLKGLKGYQIPPIIMLTANAITGVREEYLRQGFDDYISKPIDVNELDKVINKFFVVKK